MTDIKQEIEERIGGLRFEKEGKLHDLINEIGDSPTTDYDRSLFANIQDKYDFTINILKKLLEDG